MSLEREKAAKIREAILSLRAVSGLNQTSASYNRERIQEAIELIDEAGISGVDGPPKASLIRPARLLEKIYAGKLATDLSQRYEVLREQSDSDLDALHPPRILDAEWLYRVWRSPITRVLLAAWIAYWVYRIATRN